MMRASVALAVLATFLAAPSALAQSASATVAVSDVPTSTARTNETQYFEPFTVKVTLSNLVCPTNAGFPVTLSAKAGVATSVQGGAVPTNVSITFQFASDHPVVAVPAGIYVDATKFSGQTDASFVIHPTMIPYGGLDVPVTLAAALPDDAHGCQKSGSVAAQAAPATWTVHFGRGTEPAPVTTQPKMPGPGALALGLAVVGVVGLMRRRT